MERVKTMKISRLFINISFLLAVSFGVYAEDKETVKQDETLKTARESFVNADFKTACEQYKKAYDRDNASAGAICGLIDSLIYSNKWWEAYKLAQDLEKQKPKDTLVICAIARANYRVGEVKRAYDLYRDAYSADNNLPQACLGQSEILSFNIIHEKNAEYLIKKAEKIADEYPYYWLNYAGIDSKNRDFCLPYYEKYLKFDLKYEKKINEYISSIEKVMKSMKGPEIFKVKGPDESSMKFEKIISMPVITATINNRTAKFFFDTGSNIVLLSNKFAGELGIKGVAEARAGTSNVDLTVELFTLDSVKIGEYEITDCLGAKTAEFDSMVEKVTGQKGISDEIKKEMLKIKDVAGIIPAQKIFYHYKMQIDYKNSVINIFKNDEKLTGKKGISILSTSGCS